MTGFARALASTNDGLAPALIALGRFPAIDLLVKSTLVFGLALAAVSLARNRSAAFRSAILSCAFVAVALSPLVGLAAPRLDIPVGGVGIGGAANSAREPVVAVPSAPGSSKDRSPPTDENIRSRGRPTGVERAGARPMGEVSTSEVTAATWFAGFLLFFGRVVRSVGAVYELRRRSIPWLDAPVAAPAFSDSRRGRRPVSLLLSDEVETPVAIGWRTGAVVFPTSARTWSEDDLAAALAHELEHVRRRDFPLQLVARVTRAVWWFHPLAHVAWRRFSLECERACDDAALRARSGVSYARQLVENAWRLGAEPAHSSLAMARRSDLARRVRSILDETLDRRRLSGASARLMTAATGALLLVTPVRAVPRPIAVGVADPVATMPQTSGEARPPSANPRGPDSRAGVDASSDANDAGVWDLHPNDAETDPETDPDRQGNESEGDNENEGESESPLESIVRGIAEGVSEGRREVASAQRGLDRALFRAAKAGDPDRMRLLIDDGADVNAVFKGDGSPLIAAAREGHEAAVSLLLDRGANPDLAVPGDGSPLIVAAGNGHEEVARELLGRGSDPNLAAAGDGAPLIAAAANGFIDLVEMLLDHGARIDLAVPGDENALIQAAASGHEDVVRLLVRRGADVNARVWAGSVGARGEWRTALQMARRHQRRAVVQFLLEVGAAR
jgi:hypothetical protein